jgi:hypothetical protein
MPWNSKSPQIHVQIMQAFDLFLGFFPLVWILVVASQFL